MSDTETQILERRALFKAFVDAGLSVAGLSDWFSLIPATENEVQKAVGVALHLKKEGIFTGHFSAISSGKNWGVDMGSGLASPQHLIVPLNLSRLKKIEKQYDNSHFFLRVGAGVTQGELHQWLRAQQENNDPSSDYYMISRSGAGEKPSYLGNALENGFGSIGKTQHEKSLHSIRVCTGTSKIIDVPRDPLNQHGGLISTFYNSANGAVTEGIVTMTLRPEVYLYLNFDVKKNAHDKTENIYNVLREAQREFNHTVKIDGISLQSPERRQAALDNSTTWKGIITIRASTFGTNFGRSATRSLISEIQRQLHYLCENFSVQIYDNPKAKTKGLGQQLSLRNLIAHPFLPLKMPHQRLDMGMLGEPSDKDLVAAYYGNRQNMPDKNLDPGRDGCGIRFAKFVGPDENMGRMQSIMRQEFVHHGYPPVITVLGTESNLYDGYCLGMMLYSKSPSEDIKSKECWLRIYDQAAELAFTPQAVPYDLRKSSEVQSQFIQAFSANVKNNGFGPSQLEMVEIPHPFDSQKVGIHSTALAYQMVSRRQISELCDPLGIFMPPAALFSFPWGFRQSLG